MTMYHFSVLIPMLMTVTQYGFGEHTVYKLTYFKRGQRSVGGFLRSDEESEKAASNLYRAKGLVREYAMCNPWEWFVTLTLDGTKQDRYSLAGFIHDLGVWIGNYNRKFGVHLKYLLIPEQHKDGAWHMHGFFHDVASESIVKNEHGYFDMPYYRNRFGYISLSQIRDVYRASTYISKYVTKSTGDGVNKNEHMFYHSMGLEKAYRFGEYTVGAIPQGVYENEYVGIEWVDGDSALIERLNHIRE